MSQLSSSQTLWTYYTLRVRSGKHYEAAYQHLCEVNSLTRSGAEKYIELAFKVWRWRSRFQWSQDFEWLEKENSHFTRLD